MAGSVYYTMFTGKNSLEWAFITSYVDSLARYITLITLIGVCVVSTRMDLYYYQKITE